MEPEQPSPNDNQGWQQAVNPRLTERLMRPAVRPGVIAQQPSRAILSRMQHTGMSMPLLDRVLRHAQSAEDAQARVPIVYAQHAQLTPAREAGPQTPAAPLPIVQAQQPAAPDSAFARGAAPIHAPTESARPIVQAARAAETTAAPATTIARATMPAPIPPPVAEALPHAAPAESSVAPSRIVLPAGRRLRRAPADETAAQEIQRAPAPTELVQRAPTREVPLAAAANDQAPSESPADATLPAAGPAVPRASRQVDPTVAAHTPVVVAPMATRTSAAALIEAPRPSNVVSLAGSNPGPLPSGGAQAMGSRPAVAVIQRRRDLSNAPLPVGPMASLGTSIDGAVSNIRAEAPLPIVGPALAHPIVAPIQRASRAESPPLARGAALARPASAAGSAAPTSRAAVTTIVQTMAETSTAPAAADLPDITASAPAAAADVSQVAEQVYSLLVQRLTSERERRGL